ncbi:hypothetical protein BHM03_00037711 [Ensete ventricosum]|nr:hypothetical protein BHM03_00037711 [Ensete ventricosum]
MVRYLVSSELGTASSPHRKTRSASSLSCKMRRHLVLQQENEAAPRPQAGREGNASSSSGRQGSALVFAWKDEAAPPIRETRRGDASFFF